MHSPAVVLPQVTGPKLGFVLHPGDILDVVAQVKILNIFLQAEIDHGEDIKGAQAAGRFAGIEVEIKK